MTREGYAAAIAMLKQQAMASHGTNVARSLIEQARLLRRQRETVLYSQPAVYAAAEPDESTHKPSAARENFYQGREANAV